MAKNCARGWRLLGAEGSFDDVDSSNVDVEAADDVGDLAKRGGAVAVHDGGENLHGERKEEVAVVGEVADPGVKVVEGVFEVGVEARIGEADPVKKGLGLVAFTVGALNAQDVGEFFPGVGGRQQRRGECGIKTPDVKHWGIVLQQ